MVVGAALGLAKLAVSSGVAGKLAKGVGNLFSGNTKKKREAAKKKEAATTKYSEVKTQSGGGSSGVQTGFLPWMRKNWYWIAGGVAVVVGLFFVFKRRR